MIYCPICGTNNRHGSKFCNECGTELRERGQIRCPACGEMNPTGAAACDSCGEELAAPVIPIPPGSGFMVPDEEEAAGATQRLGQPDREFAEAAQAQASAEADHRGLARGAGPGDLGDRRLGRLAWVSHDPLRHALFGPRKARQ